jgi:hypothetical protein
MTNSIDTSVTAKPTGSVQGFLVYRQKRDSTAVGTLPALEAYCAWRDAWQCLTILGD